MEGYPTHTGEEGAPVLSAYREVEKKYKRKGVPRKSRNKKTFVVEDFSDVLDFHTLDCNTPDNLHKVIRIDTSEMVANGDLVQGKVGQSVSDWKVFSLRDYPGAYPTLSPR